VLEGRVSRLYLLKGEVSKNFWTLKNYYVAIQLVIVAI